MVSINTFMSNFNTTIENASNLLEKYNNIKGKLTGNYNKKIGFDTP